MSRTPVLLTVVYLTTLCTLLCTGALHTAPQDTIASPAKRRTVVRSGHVVLYYTINRDPKGQPVLTTDTVEIWSDDYGARVRVEYTNATGRSVDIVNGDTVFSVMNRPNPDTSMIFMTAGIYNERLTQIFFRYSLLRSLSESVCGNKIPDVIPDSMFLGRPCNGYGCQGNGWALKAWFWDQWPTSASITGPDGFRSELRMLSIETDIEILPARFLPPPGAQIFYPNTGKKFRHHR